jgi:hypothetical protein
MILKTRVEIKLHAVLTSVTQEVVFVEPNWHLKAWLIVSSKENDKQNVSVRLYQCIPHQNQIILCASN